MKKQKTLVSWSTGKDAAWTCLQLANDPAIEIVGIFCSVNAQYQRTAVHSVRIELLQRQAAAMNLPLDIIEIPYPCSNIEYEAIMDAFVEKAKQREVVNFAYGDLFLADIKNYRVNNLKGTGIEAIFPLWELDTQQLANDMLAGGQKAIVTCVDPRRLSADYVGKVFDDAFIASLPEGIDPCGENGEFHTFVFDSPLFSEAIDIKTGELNSEGHYTWTDLELA
ncbi:MAG: ATP-binding protein [Moritella sp.]|uniref:Dph6-related ATP pyrophosphatase n=1 Tax=Moritella sp. PE36 TaxID=58051 RepID=UPI0001569029|nr:ATPase [Moritella sp. PE36]EDM65631.1 hypothetical protein PE36_13429 [Moritella sp. PE36]PHR90167.1 MAG: ATP-binding protein [Moritella sp.]